MNARIIEIICILILECSFLLVNANSIRREIAGNKKKFKKEIISTQKDKLYLRLRNEQILIGNRKVLKIRDENNIVSRNIVYEFLGLPFGEAPVNEKRFQFAHKLAKTLPSDLYDATYFRPSCMQEIDKSLGDFYGAQMWNPPYNISEDCLYFNIWVPVTKEQDELIYLGESVKHSNKLNDLKYVMNGFIFDSKVETKLLEENDRKTTLFWVYGGSFNSGSANLKITDGTVLASFENVIVITSNYRTGPFGFLFLNSSQVPGNAGLADQTLAIEWYRENYLNYFGASTTNVCLFGESSGSMSLHNLLISKKSHLFNRLIFQSSSSYLDLSYRKPTDAYKVSLSFIEKVGCNHKKSSRSDSMYARQVLSSDNNNNKHLINETSEALKIRTHTKQRQSHKWNYGRHLKINELERVDESTIRCLLRMDASVLSAKQWEIDYVNEYLKMQFVPTSDYHNLVTEDPSEYDFRNNENLDHEILVGFNNNEGTYFSFYMYNGRFFDIKDQDPINSNDNKTYTYNNEFVYERLLESLRTKSPSDPSLDDHDKIQLNEYFYKKHVDCISDIYTYKNNIYLNDFYNETLDLNLNTKNNLNKNSPNLAWFKFNKIIGDLIFSCPSIKLANKYSEFKPQKTFFYKFNKRSMKNPWPKWLGVPHGYEIEYVFGAPFFQSELFDDDDRLISLKMMNYWANFGKTGKLFSEYDSARRNFYVDFSQNSLNENYNLTEEQEYDQFNDLFRNCEFFNKLPRNIPQVSQYEKCFSFFSTGNTENIINNSYYKNKYLTSSNDRLYVHVGIYVYMGFFLCCLICFLLL